MARLMATALLQSVEAVREFQERLTHDLPEIETVFNGGNSTGSIAGIETGLSDPHDGGRTVMSVEFASGLKLIYKPKCLALEQEYFRFTAWMNGFETFPPFRRLNILDRGSYGWVEPVEHRSCGNEDEVRCYYRRSGIFLCLVYAFNGIDFHYENLIADGEHPVPIDLETIYHHRAANPSANNEPLDEMAERLRDSVLATDLLPDPVKMNHQYFDISALARSVEEEGEFEVLAWKHINTDEMDYDSEKKKPAAGANLPLLKGNAVSPDSYTGEIVEGFREAYRFMLDHKDELLAEGGPLRDLFAQEARFVFRSTAFYTSVLKKAFHPDYLRDGIDISLQMDILTRSFLRAQNKPST